MAENENVVENEESSKLNQPVEDPIDEIFQEGFTYERTPIDEENDSSNVDKENKSKKNKRRRIPIFGELLFYIIMILLCIFVVPQYVVQRTIVDGHSMEDTLQDHDNLLVEKLSYRFDDPKRFDVIVFYPYGKEQKEYYVKRIIGLPGETVQIIGTDIYIDGQVIKEDYGKMPIEDAGIAEESLKLANDEYFVMGDNRRVSLDSRYEQVGPVKRELIAGKAVFRIWPFSKFGFFQ